MIINMRLLSQGIDYFWTDEQICQREACNLVLVKERILEKLKIELQVYYWLAVHAQLLKKPRKHYSASLVSLCGPLKWITWCYSACCYLCQLLASILWKNNSVVAMQQKLKAKICFSLFAKWMRARRNKQ